MLAVTLLGFLLTGAATLIGFSRLDGSYNASRLVRKEAAVAKSLGFALKTGVGGAVEATSLSWTVMPGAFADRILEIEAVHGVPLAVYRLDGSLFVTSSASRPNESGFATEVDSDVLIALAQGAERWEVPIGNGDYLAYWYQVNSEGRPVALVALRYASRTLEAGGRLDFLRTLGAVFVLVFFVAIGLAFLLAKSISQPLSRLGAMMERMDVTQDRGFEPLEYHTDGGDEIARLVERYNRMAENVRRSAAALAKSERESAWREMAMQVAHEIKNPLTPIRLSAERIKRKFAPQVGGGSDQLERMTDVIVRQTDELSRIVDEFSQFARMPEPDCRPTDFGDFLRGTVLLQESGQPDVKFTLDLPDETLWIDADASMIGRAVTNLLKNAGESIGDRKAQQPDHRGEVRISATQTDRSVVVEISDNGTGLPEDRARLLEPYVTNRVSGTGLGLSIVVKTIEEHGGTFALIDAEAFDEEARPGAKAVIKLPRLADSAAQKIDLGIPA